jgi:predicted  nucleic acid-binding Zn-ribbon protein
LQEYHKLVELYRQELQSMKTKIENINEEIVETTTPLVESLYRSLELGMIQQKEENGNFQEQLTDLKKEKSILSQMIVASSKRTEHLHEEVGHY